jgi:hypothetical protein
MSDDTLEAQVRGLPSPCVTLMQPTFMPWQGYFALIAAAECFVFLDDFQFSRGTFDQRNRLLLGDGGVTWVTMPVGHTGSDDDRGRFNAVVPRLDATARRKLLMTVKSSYAKTAFFAGVYPAIEAWLTTEWRTLADLNIDFIKRVTVMLGYDVEFRLSSELTVQGTRSTLLAAILRAVGAGTYLSAKGSFGYMQEDGVFPLAGLTTVFQDFVPRAYPQRQSDTFVSHLSVLDALFQVGPEQTRQLIADGQRAWVAWDAMASGHPPQAG